MNQPIASAKARIDSIDILRGVIMIIMALDHVRDFFHLGAMTSDPTDPSTTTPILFFTRWITHFCAPIFVFLAGTSAFLTGTKRTKKEMSVFLLKRGLWLMIVDLVIFNLLFSFDPLYHAIFVQVLWVTGVSMIILSACLYLPLNIIFVIGLGMVAGHNLLDTFNAPANGQPSIWWAFLHQQNFVQFAPGRFYGVFYPLIPWPGIMMLGYCLGSLFVKGYDPAKRRSKLLGFGITAVIVFFVLRFINVYGDLRLWATQKDTTATILSYFNVTKYPPSLLYCCMTIGPGLIMLAWLEKIKASWTNIAVIYGRVPMFYYLFHFFVIHTLCVILFFATGRNISEAASGMMAFHPNDFGFSLGIVYLIWVLLVAGLYPLCKKYSIYKATHDKWWLTYL